MRKLLFLPIIILVLGFINSCSESEYSDVWTQYAEWRKENENWILMQANLRNPDGTLYYDKVVPAWNNNAYILMHFFNDTTETSGNLVPMFTSTVAVKYKGRLYDDTPFDSSYLMKDSLYITTSEQVISGWQIALANMHVGDSCEIIIPYEEGYFYQGAGLIPPFSCLTFNMKLVDIPYYEVKP